MEEEERNQKLRAGKEKLAQFQKKKKRKKQPCDDASQKDIQIGGNTDVTSPSELSSGARFVYDSDQQSMNSYSEDDTSGTSGTEDTRAYLTVKSKLQEQTLRVEELEESLVGKQLALDKVIQDNEKLRKQLTQSELHKTADANDNLVHKKVGAQSSTESQSSLQSGSRTINSQSTLGTDQSSAVVNGSGNQEFNMVDIQELACHVQWLQLQLKQASGTLKAQNERQQSTVGALQKAKDEILVLQDSIIQKDQIVSKLAEKLTHISTEYGSLKQEYAMLAKAGMNTADRVQLEQEMERLKEHFNHEMKTVTENIKIDKDAEIEALKNEYDIRLVNVSEELNAKLGDMEAENFILKSEKEAFKKQSDELIIENEDLKSNNETLVKGLEILKKQHKQSVSELNDFMLETENLKQEKESISTESNDYKTLVESLKAEKDANNSEIQVLGKKINNLQELKQNMDDQIKEMQENLEKSKNESDRVINDNIILANELTQVKDDNVIYQSQIEEYEDKISQSEDVLEENHSLRVQNDELYNKINNQKDAIAALKSQVEVVSCENAQLVGQLKELAAGVEQYKDEIGDWQEEREKMKTDLNELKGMLEMAQAENMQYKSTHLSLNNEIQNLKQELINTATECDTCKQNVEDIEKVGKELMDHDFMHESLQRLKPIEEMICVQETILPEILEERLNAECVQTHQNTSSINHNNGHDTTSEKSRLVEEVETEMELESQTTYHLQEDDRDSISFNADELAKDLNAIMEHFDLVNTNSNSNPGETEENVSSPELMIKAVSISCAKESNENEKDAKIAELECELEALKLELDQLKGDKRVSNALTHLETKIHRAGMVNVGQLEAGNDETDHSEDKSDDTRSSLYSGKTATIGEDTAYHSFDNDSNNSIQRNELSVSETTQLENLQLALDNVGEILYHKIEECEMLKQELDTFRIGAGKDSSKLHPQETMSIADQEHSGDGDNMIGFHGDSAEKVSDLDIPSIEASELEVNLHASSTPSRHGLFLSSVGQTSVGIYVGGVSNDHEFQTLDAETGDGNIDAEDPVCSQPLQKGQTGEDESFQKELYESDEELSRHRKEILYLKEISEQCRKEKEDLMDLLQLEKSEKMNVLDELERIEQLNTKIMKDDENQNTVITQLQDTIGQLHESLKVSEKGIEELRQEYEKVSWERDELMLRLNDMDKDNMEMQSAKTDSKYREEQVREELSRVKERLEYLESSEGDFFEMKETLEKIQEEKENILMENEKLQGSLSAQIEENERIFETMEALHKENADVLQNMRESNLEISKTQKCLKQYESENKDLQIKMAKHLKKKEIEETKFMCEIEGLLEENSTLKTKVQSKDAEIEILDVEVARLQSFFPNIVEQKDENNVFRSRIFELEAKHEEFSMENENLVSELMENQQQLAEVTNENELLLDKCDEFQRIVADLDDEKTGLLEMIEQVQGNADEKIKEKELVIEKYEMQLGGLDEENATLKTQVLSLKQDLQEVLDQTQTIDENNSKKVTIIFQLEKEIESLTKENIEFKTKVTSMEHDLIGLVEQVNLYDDTITEKADLATRLEQDMNELLEENTRLNEQCSSLDHDFNEAKEREGYLKEQLKIYEASVNSGEGKTGEIERLCAQLELETRYKNKLQRDLESAQSEMNKFEQENRKLVDEIENLHKEFEILEMAKQGDDAKINDLSENLKIADTDKAEILVELNSIATENKNMIKEKESLKSQIGTLQTHLNAVSENRNHIRHQVEILAAELENLTNSRDDIASQYNNIEIEDRKLRTEIAELTEKMNLIELENKELREANSKLKLENDDIRGQFGSIQGRLDKVDEILKRNLDIESENRNLNNRIEDLHVRLNGIQKEKGEYELLTEELTNMLHDMQSKYEEVKSDMETTKKKCDKEISQLQSQLQVMNDDVGELRKMLDFMENEMCEAAEEKTVLKENLEEQQAQYVEAVEQKQKLEEILSEKQQKDMKNMKMVSKLNQRTAQNTDTRTELEVPDNDSHFGESENSFQGLGSWGIPNMPVNLDTLRLNLDIATEQNPESNTHLVPTFASAFQFLELTAPDNKIINTSVQTNISVGEFENSGYLLDDNGNTSENEKEANLVDSSSQTEIQMGEHAILDDNAMNNGRDLEQSEAEIWLSEALTDASNSGHVHFNETANETVLGVSFVTMSEELNQSKPESKVERLDQCVQTDIDNEDNIAEGLVNMRKTVDFDSQTLCVSCQCEILTATAENTESLHHERNVEASRVITEEFSPATYVQVESALDAETDNDTPIMEDITDITENISVASFDSGVDSASTNFEKPSVSAFKYPNVGSAGETNGIEDIVSKPNETEKKEDNGVEYTGVDQIELDSVEENIDETVESINVTKDYESQTDIELMSEEGIEKILEEKISELEATFERKSKELEDQIKDRVTRDFDFREKKIQSLEENYEKKVKNIEYEIEEKHEQKFRKREVEIVMEMEKEIREHANEVEQAAIRNIERVKIEKDQQFVKTLQKVRVDLARRLQRESGDFRRTVSHDIRDLEQEGSAGDTAERRHQQDTGDHWKLQQENRDLEIARDALLQKIDITQQEQEVLQQDLLSIMGEQSMMGSSQQQTDQDIPSWLNWQLVPEFSFDSVTSTIDQRSLSGSLDQSSFCSNSDCLSVRMRYEQLTEKIQQFLKIRTSQSQTDTTGLESGDDTETGVENIDATDSVPEHTKGYSRSVDVQGDCFVEHNEPESQMLERITSIHLEHSVRVPRNQDEHESGEDQFVAEAQGLLDVTLKSVAENNDEILDIIVNESENQGVHNEGHFSENEFDDDIGATEESKVKDYANGALARPYSKLKKGVVDYRVGPFSLCRASFSGAEEGHFSEDDLEDDEETQFDRKRKRHYSDSDANKYIVGSDKIKTSQSDNTEGHFVIEKSSSKSGYGNLDTEVNATNILRDDSSEDEVFEDIVKDSETIATKSLIHSKAENKINSKTISKSKKGGVKRLELGTDMFIIERSPLEEQPPGSEKLNLKRKDNTEPLTGEESGDFFEEKLEQELPGRPKSAKTSRGSRTHPDDHYERKKVSKPEGDQGAEERADSGDILESLMHEIETSLSQSPVDHFINESGDHANETLDTFSVKQITTMSGEFFLEKSPDDENKLDTGASKDTTEKRGKEEHVESGGSKMKEKGTELVAKHKKPAKDLEDVHQNLRADFSTVQQPYSQGKQSYENTVFDMLNSICPGTDPTRILGFRSDPNTVDPIIQGMESTAGEFSESPIENEDILAKCNDLKNQICQMSAEKEYLEKKLIEKDKEVSEKADVEERVNKLEQLNKELKQDALEIASKIEEHEQTQTVNGKLAKQVEELKIKIDTLEKSLKGKIEEFEQIEKAQTEASDEMEQIMIANEKLDAKCRKLDETISDYVVALKELSKENNKLSDNLELLSNKLRVLEKEIEDLGEAKLIISTENDSLKNRIQKANDLENAQLELKKEIEKLISEKDEMLNVLQSERETFLHDKDNLEKAQLELKKEIEKLISEKDEILNVLQSERETFLHDKDNLEKALISQADMCDKLEGESRAILGINLAMQNDEAFRNELNALQSEIFDLKTKLEEEMTIKIQLKLKEEELNEYISIFAKDKNEMNTVISRLKEEHEEMKAAFDSRSYELKTLKEEKEILNNQIQLLSRERETLAGCLHEKDETLIKVTHEKEELNKLVHKLKEESEYVDTEIKKHTEMVNEYMKENNRLKNGQKEIEELKIENEMLKNAVEKSKSLNMENEWAIKELADQVECLEAEKSTTEEKIHALSEKFKNLPYTESNDESANIIDTLRKEFAEIKSENNLLRKKLQHLNEKSDSESETDLQILEDMKLAIQSLKDEKLSIEEQNQMKSAVFETENQKLRSEIESLELKKENLLKQSKCQEDSLKKENREILKMYNDLRNEVEVLVISKHDLEIELHALKDLLEEPGPVSPVRTEHDSSRELTLQDIEEMEDLKNSIDKLKTDMKEKDNYVRKLEEHLLNLDRGLPDLTSRRKPVSSRGEPVASQSFAKRRPAWADYGRRAFSHDLPEISVEKAETENWSRKHLGEFDEKLDNSLCKSDLDQSTLSEGNFVEGLNVGNLCTSSVHSNRSVSESFDGSDRVKSGLNAEDDGHFALEIKQFELVDEIGKLRRDFRETKAIYAQETALLTEALEREKMQKELVQGLHGPGRKRSDSYTSTIQSFGSNVSHSQHSQDSPKLRQEVAVLREENKLLQIENERWLSRIKEQESIVMDLKERLSRNTSGIEEIEEVFGRQLALLQKQREELLDKLKDREMESIKLSAVLGEKGIIEDSLRREKEILIVKLQEKEHVEMELFEKKVSLQELNMKQKEFEEIIHQKDKNEMDLMRQKRLLQEELKEIESKFRDREESLGYEKNKLLDELRESKNVRNISRLSESDDDVRSVCSDSSFSDRNIGRLEIMLEEVEKQHAAAVRALRDQLHTKYSRREKALRDDHATGLSKLKLDTNKQVK